MFQRVLVPLDGSPASRAVLEQSLPFLQRATDELVLVRVVDPKRPEPADKGIAGEAKVLQGLGMNARSLTLSGEPASMILEAAEESSASLIAMTTHGRGGESRWAMGSVAEKVLRASTLPMLVMRSFAATELAPGPDFPAHVLLPIDGSELSLEAVPALRQLKRFCEPEISVVSFVAEYAREKTMKEGAEHLAHAQGLLRALGLRARTQLLRGEPASGILAHGGLSVHDTPVDLIVMSSHGRSGLSRWMLGSVTEKVLRHASVPVLVVKQRRAVTPLAIAVAETALA